ncbi:response regulator [Kaarinaea lacus]
MNTLGKILVVDDEPVNLEIMEEILGETYDVSFASSGEECIELTSQLQPELILLDISMPGMSGYEVCKRLKGDVKTMDINVTFVSALDTLADRLAGYEVGGDDYITKPFDAKELLKKVDVALKSKQAQRLLRVDADTAMRKAVSAISSTNEIGVILQFISASFECNDYDSLAQLVIDTVASFGYRCTVQFRVGAEEINRCSEANINPLEVAVLKRISAEDQQIDIGPRSIINYDRVSLLIKGMPVNDEQEYRRIKETMAVITEGAQMRVNVIEAQTQLLQKAGLLQVIQHAQQALSQLQQRHEQQQQSLTTIMQQFPTGFGTALTELGIQGAQAQALLNNIQNTQRQILELFAYQSDADSSVVEVMDELQKAMHQ